MYGSKGVKGWHVLGMPAAALWEKELTLLDQFQTVRGLHIYWHPCQWRCACHVHQLHACHQTLAAPDWILLYHIFIRGVGGYMIASTYMDCIA